jgi:hypothetical protein
MDCRLAETHLIVTECREGGELFQKGCRKAPARALDHIRFLFRCSDAAERFESQPSNAIRFRTGMRKEISGDAAQPARPDCIKASVLEGVEQLRVRRRSGPVSDVDGVVVVASPQCEPIAECTQPRQRRSV